VHFQHLELEQNFLFLTLSCGWESACDETNLWSA
jgi:hypothetical protein